MPGSRPTIRDVARSVGVSTTTVSDALNGRGRLPEATRERVREVAEALGYQARASARSLRTGRTGQIGLYSPALDEIIEGLAGTGYYLELAMGAAAAALAQDLALVLLPPGLPARRLSNIELDGLIVSDPLLGDPTLRALEASDLTVVTCERDLTPNANHAGCVRSDHTTAMYELLDHLVEQGAERIGLLAAGNRLAWTAEITDAYRSWCVAHQMPDLEAELPISPRPEYAVAAATQLFERDAPDAIVCAQDEGAASVLGALTERGLRVPDDLLLASCVEGTVIAHTSPPVTAIDLQPGLTGRRAAELLARLLTNETERGAEIVIPTRLIARGSTLRAAVA